MRINKDYYFLIYAVGLTPLTYVVFLAVSQPRRDNILRGMGASLLCVPCRHNHSANPVYCTTASCLKTVSGPLYLAASKDGVGPTIAAEGRYEILEKLVVSQLSLLQ
jgi:hypothetical protein